MRELIDLLHLLTCQKPHSHNPESILERQDNICYYYIEMDMADGDEMPDHILWEDKSEKFKFAMGFLTNEATLDFIKDCVHLNYDISRVTCGLMGRKEFIKKLVDL